MKNKKIKFDLIIDLIDWYLKERMKKITRFPFTIKNWYEK